VWIIKAELINLKERNMKVKSKIMNREEIEQSLKRMALEIAEKNNGLKNVYFIGIRRRGVPIANRMAKYLKEVENINVPVGILDITLYRDDLSTIAENPVINDTQIDFKVKDTKIILIDDVLYTGKTIQAAINVILNFGIPEEIQLCVLIDRGHHKIPIMADFVGRNVPTSNEEIIKVSFIETDIEENVKIVVRD